MPYFHSGAPSFSTFNYWEIGYMVTKRCTCSKRDAKKNVTGALIYSINGKKLKSSWPTVVSWSKCKRKNSRELSKSHWIAHTQRRHSKPNHHISIVNVISKVATTYIQPQRLLHLLKMVSTFTNTPSSLPSMPRYSWPLSLASSLSGTPETVNPVSPYVR